MPPATEEEKAIDEALQEWRQGDVCLDAGLEFLYFADLTRPVGEFSFQYAKDLVDYGEVADAGATPIVEPVSGVVILTQTCDVVRKCKERPFVEVAPLAELSVQQIEETRRLKRPGFAYVPATASDRLVADLDRTMTVEKTLVAGWTRLAGCRTDKEERAFARALARKRARFAFPNDFVAAAQDLRKRIVEKHGKESAEGAHLRALREIRVRAAPSWNGEQVDLSWWFVKDCDPPNVKVDWTKFVDRWLGKFDTTGRFRLDPPTACRLEDMTARDYIESDGFDLDSLSVHQRS